MIPAAVLARIDPQHAAYVLLALLIISWIILATNNRRHKRRRLVDAEIKQRTAAALQIAEDKSRAILEAAPDGMITYDAYGVIETSNQAMTRMFGYAQADLRGRKFEQLFVQSASNISGIFAKVEAASSTYELTALRRDSSTFPVEILIREMRLGGKRTFICSLRDITEHRNTLQALKTAREDLEEKVTTRTAELANANQALMIDIRKLQRAEEQLAHQAFHDALTSLPNRLLFKDRLRQSLERQKRREGSRSAVMFLDLDRFKVINDSFGHRVGDRLLVEVGIRLQKCVRLEDSVARFGGDEFVILLDNVKNEWLATAIAGRIQREISQPFVIFGHECHTAASIGIVFSATGYESADDLIRDADTAMYRAKANGKSRYEIFDKAMHEHVMKRIQLEKDLNVAVDRGELITFYQPIISLATGKLAGFEALTRWKHAERGYISPQEFIAIAEETKMITVIGRKILTESCKQMMIWRGEKGTESLFLNVNISSKQFLRPDLSKEVLQCLYESGYDARGLRFELTEGLIMDSNETTRETIQQLRALNIQLIIDDFGTGYSSLSYLHKLPVSGIKIDRAFVRDMERDSKHFEIVKTIVALAKSVSLEIIAEGIETKQQLEILRELGCGFGQGYYFARPLNNAAATEFIRTGVVNTAMISQAQLASVEFPGPY